MIGHFVEFYVDEWILLFDGDCFQGSQVGCVGASVNYGKLFLEVLGDIRIFWVVDVMMFVDAA